MMRELSLFSGGGGGVYGSKLLGWKTIGYVEYDDYCQKIISQRIKDGVFDYAPIFGDIRTFAAFHASSYRGLVDVITAGFPCQPFSTAGKQRGSDDERNMWPATLDVIRAIRPQYALLENVPGLLGKHRYFETILKDLSEAGYDVRWVCLSAAEVGAPHKRERLWILASMPSNARCIRGDKGSCEKIQSSREESVQQNSNDICKGISTQGNVSNADSDGSERGCFERGCSSGIKKDKWERESSSTGSSARGWWASEPTVGRVANGVANRSYRIRALGNGQVPAVFAEAWRILNGH